MIWREKFDHYPEPDHDKQFTKDTQDIIHENLLQFASSYDKKKKRAALMKKISSRFSKCCCLRVIRHCYCSDN